jgi:serine/threonine-protein kinase
MTPERWERVRDVLGQVLELAPEKRPQFLENACANDPSLRSEVESLLSSDESARSSFLQSPPTPLAALTKKEPGWETTKSSRWWAQAEWARCIVPAIQG